jgi:hypothetical protein
MASRRRVDLGVEEEGVAEMKWKRDPQGGGAMVFYLNTLGRRKPRRLAMAQPLQYLPLRSKATEATKKTKLQAKC